MPLQEPSDLLVSLVRRTRAFWISNKVDLATRTSMLATARSAPAASANPEPFMVDPDQLLGRQAIKHAAALLDIDDDVMSADDLCALLHSIQLLDEWHRPVAYDLSGEQWQLCFQSHVAAQARLMGNGAFNNNCDLGLLVPRYGPDWRLCPTDWIAAEIAKEYDEVFDDCIHIDLRPYLLNTSVLPTHIEASSPNDGKGAPRPIKLNYVLPSSSIGVPNRDDAHRILVAPILEDESEVVIEEANERYFVKPADLEDRVHAIVEAAFAADGSILFLPEMALSSSSFKAFQTALSQGYAKIAASGRRPSLAYVIVGRILKSGDDSQNRVIILTGSGEEVGHQDKISRWDLDPEAQVWLGLRKDGDTQPDFIEEAIVPAASINLFELPGVGRLIVLICADMNVGEPGDFLYVNGGIDWVYAPIMDRTWQLRRDGSDESWIIARSLRAATATRANVVVSNSLPLTGICNRTNAARGSSHPPATSCRIGLLIDGRDSNLRSKSIEVNLGEAEIVRGEDWFSNWEPFRKNA